MQQTVTLEQVLTLATQLSALDKVRLIEHITPQLARELAPIPAEPGKSLRGLWVGLDVTAEDIAEARQEMWGAFPRQDL